MLSVRIRILRRLAPFQRRFGRALADTTRTNRIGFKAFACRACNRRWAWNRQVLQAIKAPRAGIGLEAIPEPCRAA